MPGATETVNGGLLQEMLWDVLEEKVGVLFVLFKWEMEMSAALMITVLFFSIF